MSELIARLQTEDIAAAEAALLAMGVNGFALLTLFCTELATAQAFLSQLTSGADDPAAKAARLIHTPARFGDRTETVSALVTAASYGRHSILTFFLAQPGVNPNIPNSHGSTALCASVPVSCHHTIHLGRKAGTRERAISIMCANTKTSPFPPYRGATPPAFRPCSPPEPTQTSGKFRRCSQRSSSSDLRRWRRCWPTRARTSALTRRRSPSWAMRWGRAAWHAWMCC